MKGLYEVVRIRHDGAHVIHASNCHRRAWQIFTEIVHPEDAIIGFHFAGRLLFVIGREEGLTGRKYYNSPSKQDKED